MLTNRQQSACFTGHRKLSADDLLRLPALLDDTLSALISRGFLHYHCGMALGFDTLAAQAVLRARAQNPAVSLTAVLPCREQDAPWSSGDQALYRELLAAADKIIYTLDGPYTYDCMRIRNIRLVEYSSVCVAYMRRRRARYSGTGQTVRIAQSQGLEVINLAQSVGQ